MHLQLGLGIVHLTSNESRYCHVEGTIRVVARNESFAVAMASVVLAYEFTFS